MNVMLPLDLRRRWVSALGGSALPLLACLLAGCGSEPTGKSPSEASPSCASDESCAEDERCLEGECVPVRCEQAGSRCSADQRAVISCDEETGDEALELCASSQRCFALDETHAECRSSACEPAGWTCDEKARYALHCDEAGADYSERIDCAETGQSCADGKCIGEPCTSDCPVNDCEPGARGCLANVIAECDESGSELVATGRNCAEEGAVCFDGDCLPQVCKGAYECREGNSLHCMNDGTTFEVEACGAESQTFCNPAIGRCQPYVCQPGAAVCRGTLATRCEDDGSGPREVGLQCNDTNQTCWDGGCAPRVCTTEFHCEGRELLRCAQAGSVLVKEAECEAGTVCDAEEGGCSPASCTPNAAVCRGAVATQCNPSGQGYAEGGVDCSAQGKTCLAGACAPRVCVPSAAFCDGKQLKRCDAIGAGSSLVSACSPSEYCDPEGAACVPQVCSPGSAFCAGTVLTTCNAAGSGPDAGGSDCATGGKVCVLGECWTLVCQPNVKFCQNGHVFLCNDSGTVAAPHTLCPMGQHCSGAPGSAACVADAQELL